MLPVWCTVVHAEVGPERTMAGQVLQGPGDLNGGLWEELCFGKICHLAKGGAIGEEVS